MAKKPLKQIKQVIKNPDKISVKFLIGGVYLIFCLFLSNLNIPDQFVRFSTAAGVAFLGSNYLVYLITRNFENEVKIGVIETSLDVPLTALSFFNLTFLGLMFILVSVGWFHLTYRTGDRLLIVTWGLLPMLTGTWIGSLIMFVSLV